MRRIIDNVVATALSNCDDEKIVEYVNRTFGAGTLVKEAKTPIVKFDKSDFGLKPFTMGNTIRWLAKEFHTVDGECTVVDSNGNSTIVTSQAVAILKAVALYSLQCPAPISMCLRSILNEVDSFFTSGGSHESLVTIVLENGDDGYVESSNKKLLECCRREVFGLLREAGVEIE